jgi:hypothetical protein
VPAVVADAAALKVGRPGACGSKPGRIQSGRLKDFDGRRIEGFVISFKDKFLRRAKFRDAERRVKFSRKIAVRV